MHSPTRTEGLYAPKMLTLITGNRNKSAEIRTMMADISGLTIVQLDLELPEIQGEPEEVCLAKIKHAMQHVKGPVVVDDTSFCCSALKGLPGAYIRAFEEKLGVEGIWKLLEHAPNKDAYSQCIIGYGNSQSKSEPILFQGRCMGKVVFPRGNNGFGFDQLLEVEVASQMAHPIDSRPSGRFTLAEMSSAMKNQLSHRYRALKQLKQHLRSEAETGKLGSAGATPQLKKKMVQYH